jgi:tetratricopeptide (TPR) repeat protein
VDVQGSEAPRPYVKKFGVTFPVAVDPADVFGRAFGLKAIPESFFVDEVGIIRLHGGGPSAELQQKIAALLQEPITAVRSTMPRLASASAKVDLEKAVAAKPSDWKSRVALAGSLADEGKFADAVVQLESAAKLQPGNSDILFVWGQVIFHQGQRGPALEKLKQARDRDPDNWRIRKQIWALEHPDKFYASDSPDYGWQKEELAREKAATKQ